MQAELIKIDGRRYNTLLKTYDNPVDMIKRARTVNPRFELDMDERWLGRDFADKNEALDATLEPWQEGLDAYNRVAAYIEEELSVNEPITVKRRKTFSEDDGDTVCIDRLRSGTTRFWEASHRDLRSGPTQAQIFINVATSWTIDAETIVWRTAAAAALADSLEEAGFRCSITAACYALNGWSRKDRNDEYGGQSNVDGLALCPIKEFGEYSDAPTLISFCSGWCFRTLWFLGLHDAAILSDTHHANYSLGQPKVLTPDVIDQAIGDADKRTTETIILDTFVHDRESAVEFVRKTVDLMNQDV